MGNYRIDKKKIWKTPTTLVLELYTKFHKGKILKSKVKCEIFESNKLGKQPHYKNNKLIDTAVTKNGDKICMSVVNKSEKEIVKVLVSNLDKIIENYCIRGSNKVDLNDSKNLNKVKIEKNIIKIDKNVINLPPHSVSVFIFKM